MDGYEKVEEHLSLYARIKGVSEDRLKRVVEGKMLEMDLTTFRKTKVKTFNHFINTLNSSNIVYTLNFSNIVYTLKYSNILVLLLECYARRILTSPMRQPLALLSD